jgi:RNA polymerase sigma factor (sigma-70 family)
LLQGLENLPLFCYKKSQNLPPFCYKQKKIAPTCNIHHTTAVFVLFLAEKQSNEAKHKYPLMSVFQQQILPVRDKLYRFALRITGSIHEAEDIVQDVLAKAWRTTQEEVQDNSAAIMNWEAWCMTMTRNRSLDRNRYRERRRTSSIEGSTYDHFAAPDSPAITTEQRDLVDHARRLMQNLPEKQRLVMHLRDVEEMNYDEIAQTLEISLDQVKVNLHRARKAVREQMLQVVSAVG